MPKKTRHKETNRRSYAPNLSQFAKVCLPTKYTKNVKLSAAFAQGFGALSKIRSQKLESVSPFASFRVFRGQNIQRFFQKPCNAVQKRHEYQ
jgi:hypothetical protein